MSSVSIKPILFLAALSALGLSGCTRSINDIAPTATTPSLLPAAPVENVQGVNTLPPPVGGQYSINNNGQINNGVVNNTGLNNSGQFGGVNQQGIPNAPTAPTAPNVNTAAAPTETNAGVTAQTAAPITREAVSGTWQVVSDSSSCRMILAFTKWQGGYRAATRKCSSAELGSISAWDVKGKQVILMDANGNAIGKLYKSGNERYDGTTSSGAAIVFSRS